MQNGLEGTPNTVARIACPLPGTPRPRRRPRKPSRYLGLGIAIAFVFGTIAMRAVGNGSIHRAPSGKENLEGSGTGAEAGHAGSEAPAQPLGTAGGLTGSASSPLPGATPPLGSAETAHAGASPSPSSSPSPRAEDGRPGSYQGLPQARGVYLTAWGAGTSSKLEAVLKHLELTGLNALVIDVKDNTGGIPFDAEVKLAREIGAIDRRAPKLPELVEDVLSRGIFPIARVVVFQDPVLARAKPEWAVRRSDGSLWRDGDGRTWANPYLKEVWEYNVEVAKAAAAVGFKEIQFDYVRFPDNRGGMKKYAVFHNPRKLSEASAIEGFLSYAMKELKPLGVVVSADVFGFTATAKGDLGIGQDFSGISGIVDYVCPMVYPSHYYNSGIYGLAEPEVYPYEVVKHSLLDALDRCRGRKAKLRPWLQDFSLKHPYGPREVALQIRAAKELGIDEWLLWNPANVYTEGVDYGLGEKPKGTPTPLPPNELGKVMILVYHDIRGAEEERWSKPARALRADLERLYAEGYRPVTLGEFLSGSMDLPAGTSPVVLTFDDSTPGQFRYVGESQTSRKPQENQAGTAGTNKEAREVDPDSAAGVLMQFAREHPDFPAKATFFPLFPSPFGDPLQGGGTSKLRHLAELGFELGNHTYDHADLKKATAEETQRQLGMAAKAIAEATGGRKPFVLSLPYGSYPAHPALAKVGKYGGLSYENKAFLLVGAEPAVPPARKGFDPYRLPRVQATSEEMGKWLEYFKSHPEERYVSDGDPLTVTLPPEMVDKLDRKAVPLSSIRVTAR